MPIRSKTFSESYHEDIKLFDTLWSKCWLGLFFLALIALPFMDEPYFVSLVNLSCIAAVGALGLNILTGFTGQISLGHAAFFGIGAYTSGILTAKFGFGPWPAILLGLALTFAVSLLVGLPALKLRGYYLGMATLGFGVIVYIFFREVMPLKPSTLARAGFPMICRLLGEPMLLSPSRFSRAALSSIDR